MVQHLSTPPMVDVVIIDFMFLHRSQASFLPVHYGDVARYLLKAFGAKMVFLVCDVYGIETIKDTCREERGTITGGTYPDKLGPAQSRPRDFANMLKHDSFKNAFFKFLINEWCHCTEELDGYNMSFAQEKCYTYMVNDEHQVTRAEIGEYQCSGHLEADTMIVHYAVSAATESSASTVLVRCDDSDVFLLLVKHAFRIKAQIIMDLGHSSKNNRRCINITDLANKVGPEVCAALPAFHAFTGCDYLVAFNRKSKCRSFDAMIRDKTVLKAFKDLGKKQTVPSRIQQTLMAFTCQIYGQNKERDPDKARYNAVKGKMPKSAHLADIEVWDPEKHGWIMAQGRLRLLWFTGDQGPANLYYESNESDSEDEEVDESPEVTDDENVDLEIEEEGLYKY
ncbi:hypothetical protein WMY93_012700 [Mugilogobius chulae]|uniref:Uncharacterized protein n=1 Tax=Mugilogobius chulae TaxID=88201 RepID=A0AAW0P9D5_9GOBI